MKLTLPKSMRARFMMVVIATTLIALLANAAGLVLVEVKTYRDDRLKDARAQAEILARASTAALQFDDRKDARASLGVLKANKSVLGAALYKPDGHLFASIAAADELVPQRAPPAVGFHFLRDQVEGVLPIVEEGVPVGSVYLRMRTDFYERLAGVLGILGVVMLLALALAFALTTRLQRSFTGPIMDIARTAREVQRGDYSVRARHVSDDEIGLLADAFNRMLEEVERRRHALEAEMVERKSAEAALRVADRRKDEFLATLAHELRNPLAPITNSVQILKVRAPADPQVAWARDIVDRQVRHMARLLDDLLDVGRITANKLRLQKARVQLGAVLESALETSRPAIDAAGHELEVRQPAEPVWIDGDGVRLAQIFSNLLNNAAKYTEGKGRISLSVLCGEGEVAVSVKDNGIGIAPAQLGQVFEMFSQSLPALERSQGGLGIGLFIVRSLVEMHGGRVSAYSEGPGKGSEFVVRLPTVAAAHFRPASALADRDSAGTMNRRILVADDNTDAAETLAAFLRLVGYEVAVAHDGAAALALAAEFRPHAAVLDIGMPKLDGYELARRIRTEPWGSAVALVALTGWGQQEDRRRALQSGFQHHVTKPADMQQLDELLRSLLA